MASEDPHQPYWDLWLTEEQLYEQDVERMESESLLPGLTEALLFQAKDEHEFVTTPRTELPAGGWEDETVEGGSEMLIVTPRSAQHKISAARGCTCDCPRCPEECPSTCRCAGHSRHHPDTTSDPVSGDEP